MQKQNSKLKFNQERSKQMLQASFHDGSNHNIQFHEKKAGRFPLFLSPPS